MKIALIAAALALIALPASANQPPSGLSPQQVEGLLAGRGMGLSMPAEMNGKPGPLHVLEHADALGLSEAQRRIAAELVAGMKAAAAKALVTEIAALQGRRRWVHLEAHLAMTAALTPEQAARYRQLRHH